MPSNQYGEFPNNDDPDVLRTRIEGKRLITPEGCWEWLGVRNSKGYGMISIDGYMYTVHRVMARLCLNLDQEDRSIHILHHCDNSACFNPDHLYLGDNTQNQRDREIRGGYKGTAKLSPEDVLEIRKQLAEGVPNHKLASFYDIDPSVISKIKHNKRWKYTHMEVV